MVNSLNIIWTNICVNICVKKRAQKVFSDYFGVVKLSLFAFAFFCAFPNVKQWNMCYFLIIRIYKCYFKSWIKTTCSERTGRRIWQRSTKIGFWWNWKARSGQGIGLMAPLPSTANRLGIGGLTTPDLRSLNSAPLSYPPALCLLYTDTELLSAEASFLRLWLVPFLWLLIIAKISWGYHQGDSLSHPSLPIPCCCC